MSKKEIINILLYSLLVIAIDYIYLSQISYSFGKMIKTIQGKEMKVKIMPAAFVYMSMIGVWYMFIYREIEKHTFKDNIIRAGMLGFFIYTIFDFTNLALIDSYRLDLAIIDSFWGATLYMLTTSIFLRFIN